jgi:hypothetical protein
MLTGPVRGRCRRLFSFRSRSSNHRGYVTVMDSSGNPKHIDGRFIRYTLPGAGIEALSDDVGLFSYRLAG